MADEILSYHYKELKKSILQKIDFLNIFWKYNILRVYCKNSRPKYEIFTELQHIVESAPRLID